MGRYMILVCCTATAMNQVPRYTLVPIKFGLNSPSCVITWTEPLSFFKSLTPIVMWCASTYYRNLSAKLVMTVIPSKLLRDIVAEEDQSCRVIQCLITNSEVEQKQWKKRKIKTFIMSVKLWKGGGYYWVWGMQADKFTKSNYLRLPPTPGTQWKRCCTTLLFRIILLNCSLGLLPSQWWASFPWQLQLNIIRIK